MQCRARIREDNESPPRCSGCSTSCCCSERQGSAAHRRARERRRGERRSRRRDRLLQHARARRRSGRRSARDSSKARGFFRSRVGQALQLRRSAGAALSARHERAARRRARPADRRSRRADRGSRLSRAPVPATDARAAGTSAASCCSTSRAVSLRTARCSASSGYMARRRPATPAASIRSPPACCRSASAPRRVSAAYLLDATKSYRVTARFGVATDTGDADGAVTERLDEPRPTAARCETALRRFLGEIEQVPPMYSALKQGGVRLYELARRGIDVARAAAPRDDLRLALERYEWPDARALRALLEGHVRAHAGRRPRGGARNGRACRGAAPACRRAVRRRADDTLEQLEALAADGRNGCARRARCCRRTAALARLAGGSIVGADAAARLAHGQAVAADPAWPHGRVKIYREPRELFAIGEITADRRLAPQRVFAR